MTKEEILVRQLASANKILEEVLQQEKTIFIRDSAIKRFEIVFDLAWKNIKSFLEEKRGIICKSPLECFKEAYLQQLIDYERDWVEMTKKRNKTVHTYYEEVAEEVYQELPKYLKFFQELLIKLKE